MLGAMMLAAGAIEVAREVLEESDFYRESHSLIFRAALALEGVGDPVTAITLVAELERRGDLARAGGKVRVYELARLVPASANTVHYARLVHDAATRRGLIRVAGEIAQLGWEAESGEASQLVGRAEGLLEGLRKREGEQDELVSLYQAAQYLQDKFDNPPDESSWLPSPFSFAPRLGPGRLYVLGGYPADGKTSTGLQWFHTDTKAGFSSTFLTLEMSKWDLTERLASVMGIPARTVQTGKLAEQDIPRARHVLGEMTQIAPHARIWDAPAADIATIRAHVKAVRPSLLVVDHLHQFHLRPELERQDLEEIVRGLWRTAREFNMTVLLLAQLSRSGDKKHPFPMPTMAALKGSGAIEQLAWAVWFVYRQRDENNLPTDEALFVCAKNRSGITGTRRLMFHPREVRYTEVARDQ